MNSELNKFAGKGQKTLSNAWEEACSSQSKKSKLIPLQEWHKQVLDQSLSEYRKNPKGGSTWEEARSRILQRKI